MKFVIYNIPQFGPWSHQLCSFGRVMPFLFFKEYEWFHSLAILYKLSFYGILNTLVLVTRFEQLHSYFIYSISWPVYDKHVFNFLTRTCTCTCRSKTMVINLRWGTSLWKFATFVLLYFYTRRRDTELMSHEL